VAQTVDGTSITVEYARPQARGRNPVFGQVVHWGETWTPGANWATNITVSKDVKVNGGPLPKGSYSVWMIPQQETWTVFFHPTVRLFHTQRPSPDSATSVHGQTRCNRSGGDPDVRFASVGRGRTIAGDAVEKALVPLEIVVPSAYDARRRPRATVYTGARPCSCRVNRAKVDTLDFKVEFRTGTLMGEVIKWSWVMELVPCAPGTPSSSAS
jgi:hypothetical protein